MDVCSLKFDATVSLNEAMEDLAIDVEKVDGSERNRNRKFYHNYLTSFLSNNPHYNQQNDPTFWVNRLCCLYDSAVMISFLTLSLRYRNL